MSDLLIYLRQSFMPRRKWYREQYLQSNHWIKFRRARKFAQHYTCQICGYAGLRVDVHHLPVGYFFLWMEQFVPGLTVVLCRDCHRAEHETK